MSQQSQRVQETRDLCAKKVPASTFAIVDSGVIRGRGLATTVHLPARTLLGEYVGTHTSCPKKATQQDAKEAFDRSVTVTWTDKDTVHHVSADADSNSLFRLINHDSKPNVKLVKDERQTIWVETIGEIAAGTELFLFYSDSFDQELHVKQQRQFDVKVLFPKLSWKEALKHGSTADNVKLCELSAAALKKLKDIKLHRALNYIIGIAYPGDEFMKTLSIKQAEQLLGFQLNNIFPYVHIQILFIICIHDRLINISCCHASTGSWAMVSRSR